MRGLRRVEHPTGGAVFRHPAQTGAILRNAKNTPVEDASVVLAIYSHCDR